MKITNRSFGVEIEVLTDGITQSQIAQAIRAEGLAAQVEGYNHITRSHWKIVTDSSAGWEVVSPILSGEDGFEQIEKVSRALKSIGAKVSSKCGLHIHVDARDLSTNDLASAVATYARFESFFNAIQPPSRTNNQYCKSVKNVLSVSKEQFRRNPAEAISNLDSYFSARYHKVNLEAYSAHGTIEFRQGAGTIEADKIINWAVLMIALVEQSRINGLRMTQTKVTVDSVKSWFQMWNDHSVRCQNCAAWISERFYKFNTGNFLTVLN